VPLLAAGAHSGSSAAAAEAAVADSQTGPAQPFSRQLLECTRKLTLAYWRMPAYNLLRLLMTVACAIVSLDAGILLAALLDTCFARYCCAGCGSVRAQTHRCVRVLMTNLLRCSAVSMVMHDMLELICRTPTCAFAGLQVYGSMYYKVGQLPSPATIGNVQNTMGEQQLRVHLVLGHNLEPVLEPDI
jgi:hypothetical protein